MLRPPKGPANSYNLHGQFVQACTRKTRLLDVVYNASNNELVRDHHHQASSKTILKLCKPKNQYVSKPIQCLFCKHACFPHLQTLRAPRKSCLRGFDAGLQVRTQTLVKNAIVLVDATPFKQYYLQHYGVELGTKKKVAAGVMDVEQKEKEELQSHSKHVNRKHQQRAKGHKAESVVSHRRTEDKILPTLPCSEHAFEEGRCPQQSLFMVKYLPASIHVDNSSSD